MDGVKPEAAAVRNEANEGPETWPPNTEAADSSTVASMLHEQRMLWHLENGDLEGAKTAASELFTENDLLADATSSATTPPSSFSGTKDID